MKNPTIRPACIDDIDALVLLVQEYWHFEALAGFDRFSVRAQLRRLISTPALGATLVASSDTRPLGYLLLVYVFSLENLGLTAEIDEVYVVPGGRSQGVGQALLAAADNVALQAGCRGVSLQLARGNERARKFYLRHGFHQRNAFELLEKNF